MSSEIALIVEKLLSINQVLSPQELPLIQSNSIITEHDGQLSFQEVRYLSYNSHI